MSYRPATVQGAKYRKDWESTSRLDPDSVTVGGGAWPGHTPAHQVPPVWRAPEGPVGQAAVPVGGGGAWPGFETTRRAKLAARTARGRAAAHGHTEQPGPTAHHAAPGTRAPPQPMFHVKHLPNHRPRYPVWPGKWHT